MRCTFPSRLTRLALAALLVAPAPFLLPGSAQAAPAGCKPADRSAPAPTQRSWALTRLAPETAWPLTRGAGVLVAVIDSGVSAEHPLLAGRVRPGRDFGDLADFDGHCDLDGHGTVIAGMIAGRDDTAAPYSGIAPDAEILPVRVLPDTETTLDETAPARIAQAIRFAVDEGADVINLSLQTEKVPAMDAAIAYAEQKNVVVVAAAGNKESDAKGGLVFPAGYETVIAVGGITPEGKHVDTSVPGAFIDVAAPGLDLTGPAPDGDGYFPQAEGGTSFAAAYVTGVVALVRSYYGPAMDAAAVRNRLRFTADAPPTGRDVNVGSGVVNPYRAVTAVFSKAQRPPIEGEAELVLPAPEEDPLATARIVGIVAISAAVVLALLVLAGAPLIRRGRRYGWRPNHNNP